MELGQQLERWQQDLQQLVDQRVQERLATKMKTSKMLMFVSERFGYYIHILKIHVDQLTTFLITERLAKQQYFSGLITQNV